FTPFIGFTTLILAIYGIKKRWRSARFWLLAAVVYIILALGGYLQIYGLYSIPLPYLALEDTFIGAMVRRASRFNVILSIPVAILAGLGVMALRDTLTQRAAKVKAITPRLVIPAVALLILFEYAVTYPTFELYTPPFYTQLAQDTDEYAILDLPMHRRSYDEQYMFYQFTHGKPLVGGHVSRPPSEAFNTINQVRFLKDFRLDREPIPEIKAVGAQLRPLAQRNVRYLILHKEFLNQDQIQRWKKWLVIDPLYEDADLVAYHTDPLLGRDYTLMGEFLPEVGAVQALVTPTVTTQDGWLTADVVWGNATTVDDVSVICLSLINSEGKAFETNCKEPEIPINKWQSGEIIRDRYRLHVNPYLAGGTYQLTAELRTYAAGLRIGERVTLSEIEVLAVERSFDRPQPMTTTDLVWGDGLIDLVGYDLVKGETQLDLTLYWHAQQRPSDSYVVFVHLIDPATGQPVVQSDAAPRGWGYPTNWWEADEYISETVTLSVADLPSGRYELFVGMYQVNTPDRLPVRQDGDLLENAAAKLTMVTKP
ncbi:MAG: hypothetical protein KDE51_22470, partial [Anaerolineales bacterium]|nr:hypothetical protein [Anaerolineales bacterium]